MFKYIHKHLKIVIAVFAALVVVAVTITAITYISRAGKIAIRVHYAPFTATVSLNGHRIHNNAVNYLEPGEYELVAELSHFTTNTETIILSEDTEYIIGQLIASDAEGEQTAISRQDDFYTVEGIAGQLASAAGAKIRENFPILQHLPINNDFYSISFAYKEDGTPKITVRAIVKFVDIATRQLLVIAGDDVTKYDIEYTLENPFLNPVQNSASDPVEFIKASYPGIIENYRIGTGQTADSYFITTIYSYDYSADMPFAQRRVVLEQSFNSWEFATLPQFLLTNINSFDIPVDTLMTANRLFAD